VPSDRVTALSSPAQRRLIHERRVITRGYLRDDGLWDIEGELFDEKTYTYADRDRGPLPAGSPMHHMRARLTVDHDMNIHGAEAAMPAQPFETCSGGLERALQQLIGASLAAGFRRKVEDAMGRTLGCTHIRELLLATATTAYQTISSWREQFMPELGAPKQKDGEKPFFLNQCRSWADTSPVVAVHFPQFHRKGE
jgi:hypothetical protein